MRPSRRSSSRSVSPAAPPRPCAPMMGGFGVLPQGCRRPRRWRFARSSWGCSTSAPAASTKHSARCGRSSGGASRQACSGRPHSAASRCAPPRRCQTCRRSHLNLMGKGQHRARARAVRIAAHAATGHRNGRRVLGELPTPALTVAVARAPGNQPPGGQQVYGGASTGEYLFIVVPILAMTQEFLRDPRVGAVAQEERRATMSGIVTTIRGTTACRRWGWCSLTARTEC